MTTLQPERKAEHDRFLCEKRRQPDMKQANEKCTRRKVIETQEDYILDTSSFLQKNYSNSVMSSSS